MSGLAKAFVVIVLVMAIMVLGVSATLYQTQKNWKEVAESTHSELDSALNSFKEKKEEYLGRIGQLEGNNSTLKQENSSLEKDKNSLTGQVGDLRKEIAANGAKIDDLEGRIAQKDEHLQEKDSEIARNSETIENLISERDEAAEARKTAIQDRARAVLDKEQLARQLEETQRELASIRGDLEDKTLALRHFEQAGFTLAGLGVQVAPAIDGVVVAVQEGIVVLSVGKDDMVKSGYEFTIYDGDRFIGKVKVQRVLEDMSGAQILFTEPGAEIRAGHKASTRISG